MVRSTKLQYEYLKQLNRINTDFKKRVPVVERDSYLNHAKDIIQENILAIVEMNPTNRNHLRQLELKKIPLEVTKKSDDCFVATYPDDFYMSLRQTVVGCKDGCGSREMIVHKVQSDDLSESLINDPNWKPSFQWRETIADEGAEGLYIFTDGTFDIEKVYLDYIRKIRDIATPSILDCDPKCYTNSSGEKICADQDFEIDSTFLWRKVVDLGVLLTLRDLGQVDDFQTQFNRILFTETIYIN